MSLANYVAVILTPREKQELKGIVEGAYRLQESAYPKGSLAWELNRLIQGESGNLPPEPPKP